MKTLYICNTDKTDPCLYAAHEDSFTFVNHLPDVDTLKTIKSDVWLLYSGCLEDLVKILKPITEIEKFWDTTDFWIDEDVCERFTGEYQRTQTSNNVLTDRCGYLVYHDNCLDGFLSAAIAVMFGSLLSKTNTDLVVIPSNYSDKPVIIEQSGSFLQIVDFSYSMEVLSDYCNRGITVELIDHHKSFVDSFVNYKNVEDGLELSAESSPFGVSSLFSRFIKQHERYQFDSELKITVSDNDYPDKSVIDSGASLTLKTVQMSPYFRTTVAEEIDLEDTVKMARRHDLWLHRGDETDQAYALSHWFKKFSKRHSARRELMLLFPEMSFFLFTQMVEEFFSTSLHCKVNEAMEELRTIRERIKTFTSSSAVREVKLNIPDHDDLKVLYISSPEVWEIGISIIGSYMVREMGADVAVMDAVIKDNEHVYSLRSNSEALSVDVSAICRYFKDAGIAISGGGHKNSAGVAFAKGMELNLFQPFNAVDRPVNEGIV